MKMKYGVLKIDDVKKYCSEESKKALDKIVLEVETGRMEEGKKPDNTYPNQTHTVTVPNHTHKIELPVMSSIQMNRTPRK